MRSSDTDGDAQTQLAQFFLQRTVTQGRPSPDAAWHLSCTNRTPRWTTRWDELPAVHMSNDLPRPGRFCTMLDSK
ncbi:DUF4113 domain-containing protein [Halomonas korlensis]|uniref:DUF4113 domain-containing protein n=1 Tax=Halomonas korlensis TaxID=463301 RepID=UPI001FE4669B|nr:DUF4113 domain-containing protein [Halomonas korlensis]